MHFFEMLVFEMYREIRDVEDRPDRLTIKLEPRLESKVGENIKRWRKEEKKGGAVFMLIRISKYFLDYLSIHQNKQEARNRETKLEEYVTDLKDAKKFKNLKGKKCLKYEI